MWNTIVLVWNTISFERGENCVTCGKMGESEGECANKVPVTEKKKTLCDHMCVGNICI